MIIKITILLTVTLSIIVMLVSLKPAQEICNRSSVRAWKVLYWLIYFFILGYCSFALSILFKAEIALTDWVLCSILTGGSLFVLLVVKLSRSSIEALQQAADFQRYHALHDELTGMPNRAQLKQVMAEHLASGQEFSMLMLDLDGFKPINDALSHSAGDHVLCELAIRFKQLANQHHFAGRIGGDEFVFLVLTDIPAQIEKFCIELNRITELPIEYKSQQLSISASLGACVASEGNLSTSQILQRSDIAMYHSKLHKTHFTLYAEHMVPPGETQLNFVAKFRQAIEGNEFELYFQPIINSTNNSIFSLEVLLRWPQADGSFISPQVFIPQAEQTHLIIELSLWIIDASLSQLEKWDKLGFTAVLQINLSVRDIQNPALVGHVKHGLQRHGIKGDRLILELSENSVIEDQALALCILNELKALGIAISLDDFGTGYSSMSQLNELPLSQLKIDRSFVLDMADKRHYVSILKTIVFLGKQMAIPVVAEGVETQEQANFIKQIGCQFMQGYLFAKPMPASDIIDWHATRSNSNVLPLIATDKGHADQAN